MAAKKKKTVPKKSAPKKAAPKKAAPKKAAPKKAAPKKAAPKKASAPAAPKVSREQRIEALAKMFHQLGAKNPTTWAQKHVDDDTDELGRFMLLRALWLRIVEPGRVIAQAHHQPHVAEIVSRVMKTAGIADLDAVVRFAQRSALDDLCRVLDDPATSDDGVRWGVFRVDAHGAPLWPLASLRQGLPDTEPL